MGKRIKLETYEFERIENNKECDYMVFKVNEESHPYYEYWVVAREGMGKEAIVTNINTGEGGRTHWKWSSTFTVADCARIILDKIFDK